jgi:hypothetical protein
VLKALLASSAMAAFAIVSSLASARSGSGLQENSGACNVGKAASRSAQSYIAQADSGLMRHSESLTYPPFDMV